MSNTAPIDLARLRAALERARAALLAARAPQGHWVGELSSSALSTATAATALAVVQRESRITNHESRIASGLHWLAQHQNADGGWGDTVLSLSNLSTTTLCWAAFGAVPGAEEKFSGTVLRAEKWIADKIVAPQPSPPSDGGEGDSRVRLDIDALARAVIARYGKDRTFSVPILTMCALAGRLGSGRDAWQHVIALPFELAACPHSWFAALRLPVVSYALPALIAIGQARHYHSPSRSPVARILRQLTKEKTLRKLTSIQPQNGGFLEATPLTSFVTMSLAGSGQVHHPVTKRGVDFLIASQRADGSWPIDTNLATWVTTLAVNAMANGELRITNQAAQAAFDIRNSSFEIRRWLLKQQYRTTHPYTHAAPGGWAWTNLPGGVPDADDTAGALLALRQLGPIDEATREAAFAGVQWLLDLQNRDGGIPTFCRGWGTLPFDQSSADITAHAIRAWLAWFDDAAPTLQARLLAAWKRAMAFLVRAHGEDGTWSPLWFGNEKESMEQNLTYGTSRVMLAITASIQFQGTHAARAPVADEFAMAFGSSLHAAEWLERTQRSDGGWGGGTNSGSTIEETALTVESLASIANGPSAPGYEPLVRGTEWLLARVESGEWTQPSPLGFYFAKLWYYEKLYPMIFTVGALNRVAALMDSHSTVTR